MCEDLERFGKDEPTAVKQLTADDLTEAATRISIDLRDWRTDSANRRAATSGKARGGL
jgi:hypothetical protein